MALEFSFSNKNLTQIQDSTLVLFTNALESATGGKAKKPNIVLKGLPKDFSENIGEAITDAPFKGAAGETLFFRQYAFLGFTNLLLVGLGDAKRITHETVRRASSNAFKVLKGNAVKSATVAVETLPLGKSKD